MFHNGICNLPGHSLLNLQSLRVYFHRSGKFADTYYFAIRNIGNMCFSVKRHHMMFAGRVKHNILFNYHTAVFHTKSLFQMFPCILAVSRTYFFIHSGNTCRRVQKSFTVHIFPYSFQNQFYACLNFCFIHALLLPFGIIFCIVFLLVPSIVPNMTKTRN